MNRYLILAVGLLLVVAVGALAQEGKQPKQPPAPPVAQPPAPAPAPEKPKSDFSKSGSFGEPHAEPGDYVVTGNGIVQVNFPARPTAPVTPACKQEFRVTAQASQGNASTCDKAGSFQAVCAAAKSNVQKACDALCAQNPKCPYAALKHDEAGTWGCTNDYAKDGKATGSSTSTCSWTGVCECFSI